MGRGRQFSAGASENTGECRAAHGYFLKKGLAAVAHRCPSPVDWAWLPRLSLLERQGLSDGMQQPKDGPETPSVSHLLVARVSDSQLVALLPLVEEHRVRLHPNACQVTFAVGFCMSRP